jgi:hypothetical protein
VRALAKIATAVQHRVNRGDETEGQLPNLKRENHFLPKCYQKGFTDSSGKVWVKFAHGGKLKPCNPRSVGQKQNLYIRKRNGSEDDKVEDFFGKEVENQFAALSRRVKNEQNGLSNITGAELGALGIFVACQAVRTLAHKQCMEEQAGGPIDGNTFVSVMAKQMWVILHSWKANPPTFRFYTPLPHLGEQFITGDHPVMVIQVNDNPIWVPTDTPNLGITDLTQILNSPNHGFLLSLSPYVCTFLQGQGNGEAHLPPQTLEPSDVRSFNKLIRGQSTIFILARDKESLA